MIKRFVKIIAIVMSLCIMLTSCGISDSYTLLPKSAMDSIIGAVDVLGDLVVQIKEEGLGSISSVFSSGDDEETSSQDDASSSTDDTLSSTDDTSSSTDDTSSSQAAQ